jgi:chromosome segregation protein
MYLKELELYNFKSFAGCHRIPFSSNFIVITGPNGSGKSNILDAIRWVFGEQRTKLLRAERSDEIIFGGNKILPPSKYTQVFITLSIPQENNIYQEFIISRKFSIEGESEYFLNDNNVRLKDLLLFLYSNGIGKHSFLFIGQGEIDFLITNNGERLKSFIEDIAGISGYEEKVKETQIRLEIIESKWKELEEKRLNLLKNLELLRKEAKTAEIYNKLSQELKNIRESLIFYQWQRIKRNIDEYYKKIIEKEENLKILENNLNILENQLLEIKRKK